MSEQTSQAPAPSRADLIAQFSAGADRLAALLRDLPASALDLSLGPGEWSIRQIVHHVADDGDVWCMALKKAIATPGAPIRFEGFPGNEAWADALAFHKRPIEPALALLDAHRRVMTHLATAFPEAWDCTITIIDPQGREIPVSVGAMIGFLGKHLDEHAGVIEAIKRKHALYD
ncbi:MAG: DinB family protein [Chloroflexi bacterium]|nr:DinB family protein [Chloroflexota bacterium]